ncbi:MAG TPA: hypothetical protein PKK99_01525 [Bacteroidia bacterium]|nr:hypothetical protein [Bacteroidia bacterium]HNP97701.1 hypothetical protein [Bacteroidia bacterium]
MIRIRILILCYIISSFFVQAHAQSNSKFNKALADSLGADEYGMKKYVLVILKTGEVTITDQHVKDSIFAGHMANIVRLAGLGKLTVAGPLEKNDHNYRGIFIFNVATVEEAQSLVQTDPAVISKVLAAEMYPWYGSAALPMYLKYHDEVKSKDF